MNTLPGIEDALTRLNELSKEHCALDAVVWKRIVPFACRREFLKDPMAPLWNEDDLHSPKNYSLEWRVLTDVDAPGPDIFVEIILTPYSENFGEESIEVMIPRKRFFATDEENETYWKNVRQADAFAKAEALAATDLANKTKAAKRTATIEARNRALLAKLKAKYETETQ